MSQPGLTKGIEKGVWLDYVPRLGAFTSPGAPAVTSQPFLNSSIAKARYRVVDRQCDYYGEIVLDSSFVNSASDWIWCVSLPVTGARWSGAADIPIREAWYSRGTGTTPYYNLPLVPTLADPFPSGGGQPSNIQQGEEDNWMHFFISYALSNGSWSITGSNTDSGNIAHGIGFPPVPRDFNISVESITAGTADIGPVMIDSSTIDATNFKISCKTAPGTSKTVSGTWKCQAEPGGDANSYFELLLSGTKPWVAASGCILGWNVSYEVK